MSLRMNGELRQAKQYRRKDMEVKGKRTRAIDAPRNSQLHSKTAPASEEPDSNAPSHVDDDAKTSVQDWSWERSEHEGLLTYHDSRKRWYHCQKCEYFNDRLYHSKMHYERIHVKNGKSMPRKRKYPNSSNVPVSKDVSPSPKCVNSKPGTKNGARSGASASSRGSPTKKFQVKSPDECNSSSRNGDRESPFKDPIDVSISSSEKNGKWNSDNARILTFGDGSYSQKVNHNCIGSGLSFNVLDLKAPIQDKPKPKEVKSEVYNEECDDEDDDFEECDDVTSASDHDSDCPTPLNRRGGKVSKRSKVQFQFVRMSSPSGVGTPSLPSSGKGIAGINNMSRRTRTVSTRSSCDRLDHVEHHDADVLDAGRRGKYPLLGSEYTEDECEELGVGKRGSGCAVVQQVVKPKILSPAASPQHTVNVLRPRTDNSISATPIESCRISFPMGTPREDEFGIMRTPTRPGEFLPSLPMSTPNFGTSPDRRRVRRQIAGAGGEHDPKITAMWDPLVCHESIDDQFFNEEEEIYDWNQPLPP